MAPSPAEEVVTAMMAWKEDVDKAVANLGMVSKVKHRQKSKYWHYG